MYKAYPPVLDKVILNTDKPDKVYRAADFAINVMVGSDPLDSTGKPSLDIAYDGDEVFIPFPTPALDKTDIHLGTAFVSVCGTAGRYVQARQL